MLLQEISGDCRYDLQASCSLINMQRYMSVFGIAVSTLVSGLPLNEAAKSTSVAIVTTSHGGHIGFLEGMWPRHRSYMEGVLGEYVDAVFTYQSELRDAVTLQTAMNQSGDQNQS